MRVGIVIIFFKLHFMFILVLRRFFPLLLNWNIIWRLVHNARENTIFTFQNFHGLHKIQGGVKKFKK